MAIGVAIVMDGLRTKVMLGLRGIEMAGLWVIEMPGLRAKEMPGLKAIWVAMAMPGLMTREMPGLRATEKGDAWFEGNGNAWFEDNVWWTIFVPKSENQNFVQPPKSVDLKVSLRLIPHYNLDSGNISK